MMLVGIEEIRRDQPHNKMLRYAIFQCPHEDDGYCKSGTHGDGNEAGLWFIEVYETELTSKRPK